MPSTSTDRKPSFLASLLTNRCPRCRRGKIFKHDNPYDFKNMMKMNEHCPVCGQVMEPEVGFYYGTGFVSYALAVMICGITFVLWFLTIGFSLNDDRIFWWIGINAFLLIALQPPLMRLSRTLWLAIFVHYDREWNVKPPPPPERTNDDMKNNW
jgi:uncharacterized protein (DUF983 family)